MDVADRIHPVLDDPAVRRNGAMVVACEVEHAVAVGLDNYDDLERWEMTRFRSNQDMAVQMLYRSLAAYALVSDGLVIGVNSAIASRTGFYSGYGFAIPINLARSVMDQLIQHGSVRRVALGISVRGTPGAR